MFKLLLSQFIKQNGRNPNNLEMILLKQKATNQAVDQRKVVSMFDRSAVNPNKPILGGKNIQETEDEIRRRLLKNNEEGIASMKSKLEDPEKKAKGGRIGLFKGAQADTKKGKAMSPGTSTTGSVRDDNPFTGGGGGGNNNNNNPPPVSTNNLPPDTTFFDKTSKSGLMSNISPSILARLARIKKGITPILGEDGKLGVEYLNEDELYDTLTNFRITQDLEDLMKTKKLDPKLKYKKEIGDNTFFDVGIDKEGNAKLEFLKKFADGGRIGLKEGDHVNKSPLGYRPEDFNEKLGIFADGTKISGEPMSKTPTRNPGGLSEVITSTTPIEKSPAAPRFMGSIFDFTNIEDEEETESKAMGGRIGYKLGTGKKGVEGLLDLIRNKFGKKSITTADKAPIPPKTLERDMFKKADKNFKNKRMLDDDEYQDFLDEVGGADQLEAYDFDGTVGSAKRILKEQKEYMDDMFMEYKKGNLDPVAGDKSPARKKFLEKKLEEMEASGDKRLMTVDEIEELSSFDLGSEMDVAKSLAPKMVERLQLKQKYPGITDDLLDKILIDDNMQRKAEVLATIDEAFRMMEKGKSADEILDTMKNVTRTKQADGGITRIGLKAGSVDKMRRLFLKAIGAGTAGVGAAKSGIFSFGKGPAKEVAKEVVQKSTTGSPPPYFFKLAEKIKMMGDDATATTDRTIAKTLKSKDGKSTYVLEEDVSTGDTIIKKINKEGDEMITDVEIMELKKGEVVMGKDGKPVKVPDEYEEVTEANARIEGDTFNDPYYSDGIKIDEIMKEVGEQAPSIKIKKASGGLARLGYQVGGDVSYDATDPIYGSSAATFTPNTVMDQFGNQVQAEMGNNFNKPLIPQVTEQASKQEGIMNSSPIVSQADGTGEIDMPIAGGNNNAAGILPVMPKDEEIFTKQPVEGEGSVVGNYNDPLPKDQLLSGFEEYKKTNPPGAGTAAMVPVTLPGGYSHDFSGSAEANAFRKYLESIGQAPYQGRQDPGMLVKFASGGIARMLGE